MVIVSRADMEQKDKDIEFLIDHFRLSEIERINYKNGFTKVWDKFKEIKKRNKPKKAISPKPKTKPKRKYTKKVKPRGKKIPKKVEDLMLEVIKNPEVKSISGKYRILKEECIEKKWGFPSSTTFTRRYNEFLKEQPSIPERVPVGKLKEKLRAHMEGQQNDLEPKF